MKKFFALSVVILGIMLIPGCIAVQNYKDELDAAKGQGIVFSNDNKTLLKCPQNVVFVKIPSCVTVIGHKAFAKCSNLTGVSIPGSVKIIEGGAFTWCTSLKNIEIPDSVTVIGRQAFSRCKALTEIRIPAGVAEIGDGVFSGCDKLSSITVAPEAASAFAVDKYGALIDRKKRKLLHLPQSFSGIYTVPEEVTSIGAVAFYCCRKLCGVRFHDQVKSIGGKAFYGCSSLEEINIPDGVTVIGDWTFAKCVSLSGVAIPDSVIDIGEMAFYGCSKLTEVAISRDCKTGTNAFDCKVIRRLPGK